MEPFELAKTIKHVLDEKKATDIKVLKVEDLTVLADYFVIATGTSSTQVGALSDEVDYKLGEMGVQPLRIEGKKTGGWILLDYGSVIVHVFYPQAREYYDLERLWADAQLVEIKE